MTGKTHVTVGCLTMGCIAYTFQEGMVIHGVPVSPIIALITTAVGSYLPDIDQQRSHLGQKYRFISKHLKHRGLTHEWYVIPLILAVLLCAMLFIPTKTMFWINIVLLAIFVLSCAGIAVPAFKRGNVDLYDALHCGLMIFAASTLITDLKDAKVICSLIFGLVFGWLMHIFADLFNAPGVPILPGVNIHLMSVKTKSIMADSLKEKMRNWQEPVWLACYSAVVLFFTFRGCIL